MAFDPNKVPKTPSLQAYLRYLHSGYMNQDSMDQEMYDYFGGDNILEGIKGFDPDAAWEVVTDEETGKKKYRLKYAQEKLPGTKFGHHMYAKDTMIGDMADPKLQYNDENYGAITHGKNIKKGADKWWTYAAPLAVGIGAPLAAGALAGAGIGGTAGLTSSVTGSGMGAAAAGKAGSTMANLARSFPQQVGSLAEGKFNPTSLAVAGLGLVPGMSEVSKTLGYANQAYNAYNTVNGLTRKR